MNGNSPVRRASGIAAAMLMAGAAPIQLASAHTAPSETLAPLLRQGMPNLAGKVLTAVKVTFPPGARSRPHRHGGAFLYAYVLAGAVRSQIEGEPAHVYRTGDSWTEKPGDHHVLTENASSGKPAQLLVVFVSNDGEALKTDDEAMGAPK